MARFSPPVYFPFIVPDTFIEIFFFWGIIYVKCRIFRYTTRHFRARDIEFLKAFALMELYSRSFWIAFYWQISKVSTNHFTWPCKKSKRRKYIREYKLVKNTIWKSVHLRNHEGLWTALRWKDTGLTLVLKFLSFYCHKNYVDKYPGLTLKWLGRIVDKTTNLTALVNESKFSCILTNWRILKL